MSGYDRLKKAMKKFKTPTYIGNTVAELVSVNPLKIKVIYNSQPFEFVNFKSNIDLSGLIEEDIGKKFTVQFSSDNNRVLVLGELYSYASATSEGQG